MNDKLRKVREKYPDMPSVPYLPVGKTVLVYRLPPEEMSAGGIILTEEHRGPKECGVLVAAGLQARDVMREHLIELGDVVQFGRFEGREAEFEREKQQKGKYLLQMKIEGVLGSYDALERVENYDIKLADTDDGPQHVYVKRKKAA